MLKSLSEVGRVNWVSKIEHVLSSYGFAYVWYAQELGDIDLFISSFNTRLEDCSIQTLQSNINTSSRCHFYKNIYSVFNPEKYLTIEIAPTLKRYFAHFRCSSHEFNIELGRHYNINRENKICHYCLHTQDILILEDEYHAFIQCPQRQSLLFTWYPGSLDRRGFHSLLKTQNIAKLKQVIKFVSEIMRLKDVLVNEII